MEKVVFFGVAALAGYLAWCPRGSKPPCPDPIGKTLLGLITGVIAAIAYLLLFLGKRAIECCDLIAVVIVAYLFSVFIYTLFFAKRET